MSADGSIILEWSGEFRRFRLALGQIFRLQDATDLGPYDLAERVSGDDCRIADCAEIIRLGLIGGGAPIDHAYRLAKEVEDRPPVEAIALARAVLTAALIGPDDDKITFSGQADKDDGTKIRASVIYGSAAVMGFSPVDVDACSLWQYTAAAAGFRRANGGDDGVTPDEVEALWQGVQDRMG